MNLLDPVIKGLYSAAAELEPWPIALQRVTQVSGSWFTQMVGVDKRSHSVAFSLQSEGAPVDGVLDYVREYHQIDPHAHEALRLPIGSVYNGERVVPAHQVTANRFYRDFFIPYGARYTIGAKVIDDGEMVSYFAVLRKPDQAGYSRAEESLISTVAFHMSGAVEIMRRVGKLTMEAGIARTLLERSARPSFLVAPDRTLSYANTTGSALLAAGTLVKVRDGMLVCADAESDRRLTARLAEFRTQRHSAATGPAAVQRLAFWLRHANSDRSVPACIWAIRPEGTLGAFGPSRVALLSLAAEGCAGVPDPLVLAAMYDLTPAEVRVACSIHAGMVVKEIAAAQAISSSTVRTHVRHLLAKVRVGSQRELAAVLNSIASLS